MLLRARGAPYPPHTHTSRTGGLYHGKLKFPDDFPFKPPAIMMLTPSGKANLFSAFECVEPLAPKIAPPCNASKNEFLNHSKNSISSGRFETGRRLCLSMSDFHPESWVPTWSVATILNGVLSFMLEVHSSHMSDPNLPISHRMDFSQRAKSLSLPQPHKTSRTTPRRLRPAPPHTITLPSRLHQHPLSPTHSTNNHLTPPAANPPYPLTAPCTEGCNH